MAVHGWSQNDIGSGNGLAARGPKDAVMDEVGRNPSEPAVTHMLGLVRAVEGEIVPRLLLARRSAIRTPSAANPVVLDAGDAQELARLLLEHEVDVPIAYVEAVCDRGVEVRDIYLGLLAPAARLLGVMWEQDECNFVQVTVGLGRLQQLLQRISLRTVQPERLDSRGHGRRVLFATTPGDAHSFGLMMVSQFFRRNGWKVFNEFPASNQELAQCVRSHSFALVGLSAGCEARLESLRAAVRAVRRHSRNPAVGIIVGGPLFREHPEWATRVGADATAADGEQAAQLAESVCALLAGEQ
jgi:MerR family transcriptional regulator, light-induced transcriptional regulator